jgi:uncharacterized Ntn-hydrolase superfamily protein
MTYLIAALTRYGGSHRGAIATSGPAGAVDRSGRWQRRAIRANPVYGHEGLRLLRTGEEPQRILHRLVNDDPGQAVRQVAILDAQGRMAVHTGASCVAAAGHARGVTCCAQANMMARDTVWDAMVQAFEHAGGEMADRLLAALRAAEREGGDIRGRQAAALVVVAGKTSTPSGMDRVVDVRVDDHPDPVAELARLLDYARAHQRASQAIEKLSAGNLPEALAELDTCCAAYPDEPEFLFRRMLVLLALGRLDEARAALRRAHAIRPGWSDLLLRFADAGFLPIGRDVLEVFVASAISGAPTPPAG